MSPQDLGRKSLLMLAGTWGGGAIGMVISVLIGRALGPGALGSIGYSTGLVGLLMAALLPGFAQAHLKRLSEGHDPGRCLGAMLSVQLALHTLLAAGLAAAWSVTGVFRDPELATVFACLLAAQVATNFADSFLKVFVAREWVVPYSLLLVTSRLARLAAALIVLAWAPRLAWVAATFVVEGLVSGLGAAILLAARYHVVPRAPTRQTLAGYWSYARPFTVTTPLALFQDSIDRVVVGHWAGLAAAGYYQVARALWEVLASVIAAPITFLFTRLSSLYARRDATRDREARDFFFHALDKLLFMTIPLAFLVWAFAEPGIALLYGEAFRPAALALRILVLAAIAANVVNPYTYVVLALDRAPRFVPVNLLRAAAYVVVLVLLVPPQPVLDGLVGLLPGEPGAAAARVFLILFPCWVYVRWTRELAGVTLYRHVGTYVGGFALLLAVFHAGHAALGRLGVGGSRAGAIAAAAAALVIYVVYLRRRHPGTAENLRYAGALLSPGDFIRFLRSGLHGPARP
jgi:O-antigen/teichoic acid export membrane protein